MRVTYPDSKLTGVHPRRSGLSEDHGGAMAWGRNTESDRKRNCAALRLVFNCVLCILIAITPFSPSLCSTIWDEREKKHTITVHCRCIYRSICLGFTAIKWIYVQRLSIRVYSSTRRKKGRRLEKTLGREFCRSLYQFV